MWSSRSRGGTGAVLKLEPSWYLNHSTATNKETGCGQHVSILIIQNTFLFLQNIHFYKVCHSNLVTHTFIYKQWKAFFKFQKELNTISSSKESLKSWQLLRNLVVGCCEPKLPWNKLAAVSDLVSGEQFQSFVQCPPDAKCPHRDGTCHHPSGKQAGAGTNWRHGGNTEQ